MQLLRTLKQSPAILCIGLLYFEETTCRLLLGLSSKWMFNHEPPRYRVAWAAHREPDAVWPSSVELDVHTALHHQWEPHTCAQARAAPKKPLAYWGDFYSPRPFWVSQEGAACCGTLLLGGACMLYRTMCKLSPFSPWSADCRKLPHEAVGAGWEREGEVAGGNPQQMAQMARASLLLGRTVMNRNPPRGWKFEQCIWLFA